MFTHTCTSVGGPATETGTYMNTLRVAIGEAGTFVLNVSTADTRVLTVGGKTETSCVYACYEEGLRNLHAIMHGDHLLA